MNAPGRLASSIGLVSLVLAVGGLTRTGAAQQPAQPPPSNSVILGQVVDAASGRPIPAAVVTLTGTVQARPTPGPNGVMTITPAEQAAAQAANAPRRIIADGSGVFVFHSLAKGSYRLTSDATGYLAGTYGQQRLGGPTKQITVDQSERRTGIAIRMWQYASLSGTVTDENGDPAVGLTMRLMRLGEGGDRRTAQSTASVQTDDRGAYRFGRLSPGEFVVMLPQSVTSMPATTIDALMGNNGPGNNRMDNVARDLEMAGVNYGVSGVRLGTQQIQMSGGVRLFAPPAANDTGKTFAYQTVFYPSANNLMDAQSVSLASGQERSGVDLQLRPVQTVKVTGTLTGPDGVAANMSLRLYAAGFSGAQPDDSSEAATTVSDFLGNFQFPAVATGSYTLRVMRMPPNAPPPPPPPPPPGVNGLVMNARQASSAQAPAPLTLWAEQPVTVGETDLTGLSVQLRAGLRVSGRVTFEGAATLPTADALQRMTVSFSSMDSRQFVGTQTRYTANGQFISAGLPPGRYALSSSSPGAGWYFKSATLGARSLDDEPLELSGGDVSGVTITFTDKVAQLTGTVRDPVAAKDLSAMIYFFPADYAAAAERGTLSRRVRNSTVGGNGMFNMGSVQPGSYLIVAVDPESIAGARDRAFYDRLAAGATRITIAEGEKKSVDLTVTRIR